MSDALDLREKLVTCLKIFDHGGLLGMYGHVSVRLPETEGEGGGGGEFLINPGAGSDKSALRPEDLLRVDHRGEKLEGEGGLPMEVVMHTAVHRRYEDAVAIARTPIRPVVLHGALFGDGIPVYD